MVNGVEASTVMQWTVNPPRLRTPGSIPGYSTRSNDIAICPTVVSDDGLYRNFQESRRP